MNLAHWLERAAHLYPTRPAIATGVEVWCDYATFALQAARTAGWLRSQGVGIGDRVVLFMHNRPEYLPLLWGIWWCGAVAVPVNAKLHPREVAWIMGHSGSVLAFCDADDVEQLQACLAESTDSKQAVPAVHAQTQFMHDAFLPSLPMVMRSESAPIWLFYTSGTTGRPKGVTLAARQLRWMSLGYLSAVQAVESTDVMLHPAPLSHGGGMFHLPYVLKGGLNVVPASGGFDAQECLALAAHWQSSSFFAAPTMVRRLVDTVKQHGIQVQGLATIIYGGGPMYGADLQDALATIGGHFTQIYGQGECPMSITVLPRQVINDTSQPNYQERINSVGYAQSMVELSIRNAAGEALDRGSSGEICVRSDVVMEGYWNDAKATAATIRDGWLYTGDVGWLSEDGFLTLIDRSKDLIISGGTNIYPREVEEALLTHAAVSEVAVIGRADAEWGEVVVAYVVAGEPIAVAELDAHCLNTIARFKRPKFYHFVDELPKNNYGKVLKTTLRECDAQHVTGGGSC